MAAFAGVTFSLVLKKLEAASFLRRRNPKGPPQVDPNSIHFNRTFGS